MSPPLDARAVEAAFRAALELHAATAGVEAAHEVLRDVERRSGAPCSEIWEAPATDASARGRWADMDED